jgi:hypothetical protein
MRTCPNCGASVAVLIHHAATPLKRYCHHCLPDRVHAARCDRSHGAERMALAQRIAKHDPPRIILPAALKPVDRKLLAKTAARLQKQKSVLAAIKCSPVKS